MEMAGSRSYRGSAFHEHGPDEQNARGPSVEVDVRGKALDFCGSRVTLVLGLRYNESVTVAWCPRARSTGLRFTRRLFSSSIHRYQLHRRRYAL